MERLETADANRWEWKSENNLCKSSRKKFPGVGQIEMQGVVLGWCKRNGGFCNFLTFEVAINFAKT